MRTKSTIINSIAGIIQTLLPSLIGFITRTIFINFFGAELLGVNTLFQELFNMLSIAELGIGSAMTYYLYRPLAENDFEQIKSIMQLYSKLYRLVGLVIGIAGLALLPFLDLFVNSVEPIPYLEVIYLMMLFQVVISYFYTYKRSIFLADQKNYVNSVNDTVFVILKNILMIVGMYLTGNYFVYLTINILITIAGNINISLKADRDYPFLKDKEVDPLSKKERKHIFSRVGAFFMHQIGTIIATGTDNILMGFFSPISFVGVYSNYLMILNIIRSLVGSFTRNITASVGNLDAKSDDAASYLIFKRADFVNYFLYAFTSVCLFYLFNPFITVWLGDSYVLDLPFIIVIVLNFYLGGIRSTAVSFVTAKGYFWDTRFKPIIEAGIDLIAGLTLGYFMGPIGVLIGTTVGFILIANWVDPYIIYKKWFKEDFTKYIKMHLTYLLAVLFVLLIVGIPTYFYLKNVVLTWGTLIGLFILVPVVTGVLLVILFSRTDEFRYVINTIKRLRG